MPRGRKKKEIEDVDLFSRFQRSPLLFIEKMWGLVSQERNGPFVVGRNLTWQQHEILLAVEAALRGEKPRKISIAAGRGVGKSAVLAWLVIWYLFCFKDAKIACTAPSADQMYDVLWSAIAQWLREMPPPVAALYDWTTDHVRIRESPETWFARAKTAKKESPEALAGIHGEFVMLIGDEASGIDDANLTTAEGSLTGEHWLYILASNPRRLFGYFYDTHHDLAASWQTLQFSVLESPLVKQKFVDEKLQKARGDTDDDDYRIEVLGLFPKEDSADKEGWIPLLSRQDLERTFIGGQAFMGVTRMGVDPSGEGKDVTSWVARDRYCGRVVGEEKISDEKSVAVRTLTYMGSVGVLAENVTIDNFGVGANVAREIAMSKDFDYPRVNAIYLNDAPNDPERYQNIRAESYLRLREWLLGGGKLVRDQRWEELLRVRYRRNRRGLIEIMPKVDMRKKLGFASPNFADALMLTFAMRGEEFASALPRKHVRPHWIGYQKL